eukprot:GFYU01012398.1.p1 GENE.GFYU01012398.1~~GFYU01012398.1.p1  ORF type:complete len:395 (+),score=118.70 GFYU01012398.1:136-1320(+)
MKLLAKNIEKDMSGSITMIPEDTEDLWHTYNLIAEDDRVRAKTIRKVQRETSTGSTESERVPVTLTIQVSTVDFDPQSGLLRLNGRNEEENKFVKLGAYHTLELELNRKFTLHKEEWDSVYLEIIDNATDPTKTAEVAAVVMMEGLAHVLLVTSSMTITRARIEVAIPRKRRGTTTQADKAMNRFFDNIIQQILRHIDFSVVKCCILASPGFTKDQFYDYMLDQAVKHEYKHIVENKAKFLRCRSSSGHKHAFKELMADPSIAVKLADTKAAGEVKLLNSFYEMLNNEPDRAFYGYEHVRLADERLAIDHLLVTDSLFRSCDMATRRKYVALVDSVRENGGEVTVFSSLHVTGEQLAQLSGVAALLRFPLPEIEEADDEGDQSDDTSDDDDDSQ